MKRETWIFDCDHYALAPFRNLGRLIHYLDVEPQMALSEIQKHPELHHEIPVMMDLANYSGIWRLPIFWLNKLLAVPDNSTYERVFVAVTYLERGDYDQFFAWANKGVDKKEFSFDNFELFPAVKTCAVRPTMEGVAQESQPRHNLIQQSRSFVIPVRAMAERWITIIVESAERKPY